MAAKEVYTGKIVGNNRGGILVAVGHIRGFVPNSQLIRGRNAESQYAVGKEISTKVIEVDRETKKIVWQKVIIIQNISSFIFQLIVSKWVDRLPSLYR